MDARVLLVGACGALVLAFALNVITGTPRTTEYRTLDPNIGNVVLAHFAVPSQHIHSFVSVAPLPFVRKTYSFGDSCETRSPTLLPRFSEFSSTYWRQQSIIPGNVCEGEDEFSTDPALFWLVPACRQREFINYVGACTREKRVIDACATLDNMVLCIPACNETLLAMPNATIPAGSGTSPERVVSLAIPRTLLRANQVASFSVLVTEPRPVGVPKSIPVLRVLSLGRTLVPSTPTAFLGRGTLHGGFVHTFNFSVIPPVDVNVSSIEVVGTGDIAWFASRVYRTNCTNSAPTALRVDVTQTSNSSLAPGCSITFAPILDEVVRCTQPPFTYGTCCTLLPLDIALLDSPHEIEFAFADRSQIATVDLIFTATDSGARIDSAHPYAQIITNQSTAGQTLFCGNASFAVRVIVSELLRSGCRVSNTTDAEATRVEIALRNETLQLTSETLLPAGLLRFTRGTTLDITVDESLRPAVCYLNWTSSLDWGGSYLPAYLAVLRGSWDMGTDDPYDHYLGSAADNPEHDRRAMFTLPTGAVSEFTLDIVVGAAPTPQMHAAVRTFVLSKIECIRSLSVPDRDTRTPYRQWSSTGAVESEVWYGQPVSGPLLNISQLRGNGSNETYPGKAAIACLCNATSCGPLCYVPFAASLASLAVTRFAVYIFEGYQAGVGTANTTTLQMQACAFRPGLFSITPSCRNASVCSTPYVFSTAFLISFVTFKPRHFVGEEAYAELACPLEPTAHDPYGRQAVLSEEHFVTGPFSETFSLEYTPLWGRAALITVPAPGLRDPDSYPSLWSNSNYGRVCQMASPYLATVRSCPPMNIA